MTAHEIDYQIFGEEMQYVEIELDPQEIVIADPGSFMMMDNKIQMETIFGDGSAKNHILQMLVKGTYRRKSIHDRLYQSRQCKRCLWLLIPEKFYP
jgi:uncharacterized protein (AIM24 family)